MLTRIRTGVGEAWEKRPPSMRTRPRPQAQTPAAKTAKAPRTLRPRTRRPAPEPAAGANTAELREMRAQRDRLVEKFTIMAADLGGAFYEMAIRDHVRLDVLTRKAAELQRVDAELAAVETALELERSDAAGICHGCGAPFGAGTKFCGQCGTSLTASAGAA